MSKKKRGPYKQYLESTSIDIVPLSTEYTRNKRRKEFSSQETCVENEVMFPDPRVSST